MGLNGTVFIYPTGGDPPDDPDAIARSAIRVMEECGLLVPGTSQLENAPEHYGLMEEFQRDPAFIGHKCAQYEVAPEQISPRMSEIVYLLDTDDDDQPVPIELPYVETLAMTARLPLVNGYDGRTMCHTWAAIGFSYDDMRYNEEKHRIRNVTHPVMSALADLFRSPIAWDVQIS